MHFNVDTSGYATTSIKHMQNQALRKEDEDFVDVNVAHRRHGAPSRNQ